MYHRAALQNVKFGRLQLFDRKSVSAEKAEATAVKGIKPGCGHFNFFPEKLPRRFLADSGGWQRWFFAGIAIGISVILAVMMYRSKATQKLNNIAYALIIGGALGNLFDRLWHGFVVDMIDFYVGDWHFATFNLADTAICVGAALIVLEGFLPSKAKKQ